MAARFDSLPSGRRLYLEVSTCAPANATRFDTVLLAQRGNPYRHRIEDDMVRVVICACSYAHTNTHAHTHTRIRELLPCTPTARRTHAPARTHVRPHARTRVHTHKHTHSHTRTAPT
jgi:hypothetical protein